jgi:glycerol-1-phosphate dehydrogenase [NAD(P)+]
MSDDADRPDPPIADIPVKLDELMGYSASCGCGRVHAVEMRAAVVARGAVEQVVEWVRNTGAGPGICLVADRITREIAGERVGALLRKAGYRVRECVLEDGAGGRPHADEAGLAQVEQALEGAQLAVAVGAGTVNDLTKLGSHRSNVPYLVVATAPSMNGYTSAIAAVMDKGVKRTVDCHQPWAVLADLDILAKAPFELTAAGLGDLESKPTATADYRLAGLIRGEYSCRAPEKVVMQAEAKVAETAGSLPDGDPQALRLLTEALLLSGLSMKLAGSSSPASGGEHLISHYWDMTAPDEGRVEGWHGAQVGVATVVTASLFGRLRALSAASIDVEALVRDHPSAEEMERRIRDRHGKRADEVSAEYLKKHLGPDAHRRELERITNDWDRIWAGLDEILRPAERVREILRAGGGPTTVQGVGLTPDHLRKAFLAAREIRGRYTVLDFAAGLGLFDQAEEILKETGCLG